jgi:tRNA(His) guanylyltransferase
VNVEPFSGSHTECCSKLVSTIVSTFTAYYVHFWSTYFPDTPLSPPLPSFDGRAVCYPTVHNLRDYMSWRQVDCRQPLLRHGRAGSNLSGHINNLYNTAFWALIQLGGMDATEAEKTLKVSLFPVINGTTCPDLRIIGNVCCG